MKTVWIISEGSPGHVSQSVGLVDALARLVPVQQVMVKGRSKVRGWLRPWVRKIMGPQGQPLGTALLQWVTTLEIPEDSPCPDLIVSSGGKSVFAAKTLAGRYDAPYVFIGERKPYPAEWFHTIISPVPGESCVNSIDVELIPTPVTPEMIAQKGTVQKGLWCMIIGGASRSHRFKEKDWIDLAEGMNVLAEREKIRWLLTTSRRTGEKAEAVLKQHLNPDILEDAIWWAAKPRRELYAFMARAEVLFVTQDSVTMVTEAISAGKRTVTVYPRQVKLSENSFMLPYLRRLEANRRVLRTGSACLKDSIVHRDDFNLIQDCGVSSVVQELAQRLGWNGVS
jgi:mitochondrial fission protein ELM1